MGGSNSALSVAGAFLTGGISTQVESNIESEKARKAAEAERVAAADRQAKLETDMKNQKSQLDGQRAAIAGAAGAKAATAGQLTPNSTILTSNIGSASMNTTPTKTILGA